MTNKLINKITNLAMIPVLAGSLTGCDGTSVKYETSKEIMHKETPKIKDDSSSNYKTKNTNYDSTKKEGDVFQENWKETEGWWVKDSGNLNYENCRDLIFSMLIRDNIERNMINNMNEDHRISPTEYLQWTYRDKYINYIVESVIQKRPHKKSKSKKKELSSEEYWWTKEK